MEDHQDTQEQSKRVQGEFFAPPDFPSFQPDRAHAAYAQRNSGFRRYKYDITLYCPERDLVLPFCSLAVK